MLTSATGFSPIAGSTSLSSTRRMLRGSLLVRLTTSVYQRFANAATVSVARPSRTAFSACLAAADDCPCNFQRPALLAPQTRPGERVGGIFAEGHSLLLRAASAEAVLHAPVLLAGGLHLDVEPAAIRELVAALLRLQSLEFRVIERHACPHGFRTPCPTNIF